MDIKDLNKSQLILLAVLLSFITSIVTGITTVTLLQQAPPTFTEPVNRVIKQTVEKIQQVEGKTITQTIVVKEEDLIVDAISKNKPAQFSISRNGGDNGNNLAAGQGFVISSDGVIVTDAVWAPNNEPYYATNDNGKFKAEFLFTDKSGLTFLKLGPSVNPEKPDEKAAFKVPSFGALSSTKAGQKIILLGDGISTFVYDGNKEFKIPTAKQNPGGMVFNLDGEVLGIALSGETVSFASIEAINATFKAATSGDKKSQ